MLGRLLHRRQRHDQRVVFVGALIRKPRRRPLRRRRIVELWGEQAAGARVREAVVQPLGNIKRVADDGAGRWVPQHRQREEVSAVGELAAGRDAEALADGGDVWQVDPLRPEALRRPLEGQRVARL